MNEYPLGQAIRFTASYANNGVATNPTVTQFRWARYDVNPPPDPTATIAQFGVDGAVLNPATGQFTYDLLPPSSGNYVLISVGTGVVQAASLPVYFKVLPSPFA
jgi:hypothetical protein